MLSQRPLPTPLPWLRPRVLELEVFHSLSPSPGGDCGVQDPSSPPLLLWVAAGGDGTAMARSRKVHRGEQKRANGREDGSRAGEKRFEHPKALPFHRVACRPSSVGSQSDVAQFPTVTYACYFCKSSPTLTIFSVP